MIEIKKIPVSTKMGTQQNKVKVWKKKKKLLKVYKWQLNSNLETNNH